jgi:hypothetical protein
MADEPRRALMVPNTYLEVRQIGAQRRLLAKHHQDWMIRFQTTFLGRSRNTLEPRQLVVSPDSSRVGHATRARHACKADQHDQGQTVSG